MQRKQQLDRPTPGGPPEARPRICLEVRSFQGLSCLFNWIQAVQEESCEVRPRIFVAVDAIRSPQRVPTGSKARKDMRKRVASCLSPLVIIRPCPFEAIQYLQLALLEMFSQMLQERVSTSLSHLVIATDVNFGLLNAEKYHIVKWFWKSLPERVPAYLSHLVIFTDVNFE